MFRKTISAFCFLLFGLCGHAAVDQTIVTLTVTNGTVDGNTITINSSVRTWKDTVVTPSTQIRTNGNPGLATTNLWVHIGAYNFGNAIRYTWLATNQIRFISNPGATLNVGIAGSWATLTTNFSLVTPQYPIIVPANAAYPLSTDRTNKLSLLVTDLSTYPSNSISAAAKILTNFWNLSNTQTGGNKTITNSTFTGGWLTNSTARGIYIDYDTTNTGIYFRNSVGGDIKSAISADSSGRPILLLATDVETLLTNALGVSPTAAMLLNFRIATNSFGQLQNPNTWTALNTFSQISNSVIATTRITNGSYSGNIVSLTNGFLSGTGTTNSSLTNSTFVATNTWTGDVSFSRANISSLANGNNSGLDFGTSVYVKIKAGPTGAFAICGLAGGRDGRMLTFENATAQTVTLANESGVDAVAANRITTGTGADVVLANRMFGLIYDSEDSRWKIMFK